MDDDDDIHSKYSIFNITFYEKLLPYDNLNQGQIKIWYHVDLLFWNVNRIVSEGTITTLANLMIQIIGIDSGSSSDVHAAATASSLAMTGLGIPVTGSISAGFTIGFIKGW